MQQRSDLISTTNGPLNASILISGPTTLAYLDSYPSGCATPSCAASCLWHSRARSTTTTTFSSKMCGHKILFQPNPFRLATLGKLGLA